MAAGGRPRRRLHLPQQSRHLGAVQPPPGADRAMAGQPRHRRIQPPLQRQRLVALGQFLRQVAQQRRRVGRAEQGRQGADQQGAGTEPLELEAEPGERRGEAEQAGAIGRRQLDHRGQQQGLGAHPALDQLGPQRLMPVSVGLGSALLVAEWALAGAWPRLVAAMLYLHVAVFGAPLLSGLWSLINERFDPYTAKRSIGTISTGASLGGLIGGLIAWSAASLTSVRGTLLALAGLGALSLWPLLALRGPSVAPSEPPPASLRTALATSYVRNLALLVGLLALTESLLDYVLSAAASASFGRGAPLLSFFAQLHLGTGVLSLARELPLTNAGWLIVEDVARLKVRHAVLDAECVCYGG